MREFKAERVPRPLSISNLPVFTGPLDLEIGAGAGLHAIQYSRANPDRTLLAVERTSEKFARLRTRRLDHPEIGRLFILHADAVSVVTHALGEKSLDRVFILYPNPYPKAKQSNLRFHNSPFMAELKRKMKEGAELTLATNMKWYADEAEREMPASWGFQLTSRTELKAPLTARTHFEKKYLERGETCFDLKFKLWLECPK